MSIDKLDATIIKNVEQFDSMIAEMVAPFDAFLAEKRRDLERSRCSDDELIRMIGRAQQTRRGDGRSGRPTKATPELVNAVCAAYERPLSKAVTARLVGIDRTTLYAWERSGNEVSQRLSRARARGAIFLHLRALAGGKGSSAAAWLLGRLFREDYGPAKRVEHSVKPNKHNVGAGRC